MAEKTKPQKESKESKESKDQKKPQRPQQEESNEVIVRIMGYDIRGSKPLYTGLTRIKGISWAISNKLVHDLKMPRNKRISELSKDEIIHIEKYIKSMPLPDYMKNRRFDPESGKSHHLFGSDLEIARDFDIKRLKKIKSWRGIRHAYNQPTRGQRTKSHFRRGGSAVGVRKTGDKK